MVRPCVDAEFTVSRLDVAVDNEVKIMCSILSKDQVARQQIMEVHQQGLKARKYVNAARAGLARRFGACCRRGSAEGFVIPVLTKLDRLTEFLDESVDLWSEPRRMKKCDVLFESRPEAFRLHQSIMETRGVSNFIELHTILTDVVDEIEAGEHPDIECFHRVTVLKSQSRPATAGVQQRVQSFTMHERQGSRRP